MNAAVFDQYCGWNKSDLQIKEVIGLNCQG